MKSLQKMKISEKITLKAEFIIETQQTWEFREQATRLKGSIFDRIAAKMQIQSVSNVS